MHNYKIFKDPLGVYEAVKQGWSWPAFFFSTIWAFIKRIWWLGFGLVLLSFLLPSLIAANLQDMPQEQAIAIINMIGSIITMIIGIILGLYGNLLREKNLLSRGYNYVTTVSAETPERAIALLLAGNYYQEM